MLLLKNFLVSIILYILSYLYFKIISISSLVFQCRNNVEREREREREREKEREQKKKVKKILTNLGFPCAKKKIKK